MFPCQRPPPGSDVRGARPNGRALSYFTSNSEDFTREAPLNRLPFAIS
jgi:hypothetical protein